MTDTTTPTVETLAKHYDEEARFLEVAQAVGDDDTTRYAATCKATAATLRALAQERDDAKADYLRRHQEGAANFHRAITAEAERDAARAEVERLREALKKIVAADWWDAAGQQGDEPDTVDGRCAEIARAALAAKGEA